MPKERDRKMVNLADGDDHDLFNLPEVAESDEFRAMRASVKSPGHKQPQRPVQLFRLMVASQLLPVGSSVLVNPGSDDETRRGRGMVTEWGTIQDYRTGKHFMSLSEFATVYVPSPAAATVDKKGHRKRYAADGWEKARVMDGEEMVSPHDLLLKHWSMLGLPEPTDMYDTKKVQARLKELGKPEWAPSQYKLVQQERES